MLQIISSHLITLTKIYNDKNACNIVIAFSISDDKTSNKLSPKLCPR